jgi:hypothetical protein
MKMCGELLLFIQEIFVGDMRHGNDDNVTWYDMVE